MEKQLIIVSGAPYSGRTTWINKNYGSDDYVMVDACTYPNLYVKSEKNNTSKLFEDTIEDSRLWCLKQIKSLMEGEPKPETEKEPEQETEKEPEPEPKAKKIVLSLIACRPDRWREFIQLAISNNYELIFKFPTNKNLFYSTKHNTTMEQSKFIESKVIYRFPKDKKEVHKKNADGENEIVMIETKESSLLRQMIIETESAYAFYLQNKGLFANKDELLKKINEQYKSAIIGDIKRAEKKLRDAEREAEKKEKEAEKEIKRLAREEAKLKKEQEKQSQFDTENDEAYEAYEEYEANEVNEVNEVNEEYEVNA